MRYHLNINCIKFIFLLERKFQLSTILGILRGVGGRVTLMLSHPMDPSGY